MYMYILRILSWGTYPRDRSPGSFSQGSLEGRPSRSTPWTDTRGSIYKGFKPVHTFGPRWGVVKSPRLTTNPPHCGTQTFRSACRSVGGTLWRVLRLSPPGVGAVLVASSLGVVLVASSLVGVNLQQVGVNLQE